MDGGLPPIDPSISLEELEEQITELAGQLNAANYRWLTLIAEFDRRHGWADGKLPSCAHWLNFKCGLNLGAAREKVRVAHAIARLPALQGAMLLKALDAAMDTIPSTEISTDAEEDRTIPHQALRADAMAVLAENYLANSASSSKTADRYQVVVHVDAETLREGTAGRCEIEQGPSIPVQTVRRLACDASLLTLLESEHGEPLDVGRKTRSIPPAIRRALHTRDGGCRFPGCTHQRYVDAHHIEHWSDGGETKLSNLVTLCRLHHRLVHEGEVVVEAQVGGGWRFLHPDGRRFEIIRCKQPATHHWEDLGLTHAELGIHIDSDTASTLWRGERMDYDLGVWVLCQQADRTRSHDDDSLDDDSSDDASSSDVWSSDVSLDDVAAETSSAYAIEECGQRQSGQWG